MDWKDIFNIEQEKQYYKELESFVDSQYKISKIYPKKENIFKAFELTKYDNLKVVILGQDPYHQPLQAQGLAFSTPKDIKNPPSLVNIFKEINSDLKHPSSCLDGDLTPWAKQGILLINTILTVEDSKPKSHKNKGWETFTDNIIKYINIHNQDIIFLLWGAPAISKSKLIDTSKHYILTSPHPSPLSSYRGFFGSKNFSKINEILNSLNKSEISW